MSVATVSLAFRTMLQFCEVSDQAAAYLWAMLRKDYSDRISDKQLHRQLFEYNDEVSYEDIRVIVASCIDKEHEGLISLEQFEHFVEVTKPFWEFELEHLQAMMSH